MYNTKQRQDILNIFIENKEKLYTPKMILNILGSNKATVYRTLEKLCDEGILNRYYDEKSASYQYQYSCNNQAIDHIHLKCLNCGKIIHLTCHEASLLINHLNMLHGFQVSSKNTIIYGTCKSCSLRLI